MKLVTKSIETIHKKFRSSFPAVNSGGCGAFAYAFVSMFGGRVWRIDSHMLDEHCFDLLMQQLESPTNGNSLLSSNHFVVEHNGMLFDAHQFCEVGGKEMNGLNKPPASFLGKDVEYYSTDGMPRFGVITTEYTLKDMLLSVVEGEWNHYFSMSMTTPDNIDYRLKMLHKVKEELRFLKNVDIKPIQEHYSKKEKV